RKWGCWTRRSPSCRRRCGRPRGSFGRRKPWACASSRRGPTWSRSRSCAAVWSSRRRAIRSGSVCCTGWAGPSKSRGKRWRRGTCTAASSPWTSGSKTSASGPGRSPRRNDVSQQLAPVSLGDIQRPVAGELELVAEVMGDYFYSRAIIELVGLDDLVPLRVFARVTNEMTIGEMRQLEAHDKLAYDEAQYDELIRSKTASLLAGACEVGALRAPAP